MGKASAAIELQSISMRFSSEPPLFTHLSLTVPAGEKLVLIGPSGHGKSVLMKLISGVLEPTEGSVRIFGTDLHGARGLARQELQLRMGMLFQKNALFDSMTAAENIAFPLRETKGMPEAEIEQKVSYFLEAVGLSHARDLFPDQISGGMQKRLGIARALALDPEVILYDDPTAGLDPITSRKIIELILQLQASRGSTVIAITNDMNRAFQMADRMAMLVDGELIITGTVEQTQKHQDPRVHQFVRGELQGPLSAVP